MKRRSSSRAENEIEKKPLGKNATLSEKPSSLNKTKAALPSLVGSSRRDRDRPQPPAFRYSDDECLERYNGFKNPDEFLSLMEKGDYEKFLRGAMKANGGPLRCMICKKELSTAMRMVFHLNSKKCEPSEKKAVEPLVADVILGPPNSKRSVVISSLDQLKEEPSLWFRAGDPEKVAILKKFFGKGPYCCFAIRKPNTNPCPVLCDVKEAVKHLNKCIEPMYFTFKGDRIALFRALEKKVKGRYVREAMMSRSCLPCLECGRTFQHQYGLIYHIDRCNLDSSVRPWKCYRCGFHTTVSNGHLHLRHCWATDNGNAAVESLIQECEADLVMGSLGDVNLRSGKSIKGIGGSIEIGGVNKDISDVKAQDAITSIINSDLLKKLQLTGPKRGRYSTGASISAGVLPPESKRVRVSTTGALRFRFRKAEITSAPAGLTDWRDYVNIVRKSAIEWDAEAGSSTLCKELNDLKPQKCTRSTDRLADLIDVNKKSISFRISSKTAGNGNVGSIPGDCDRIKLFSSKTFDLDDVGEWGCFGFAGGPVHTIQFAPNSLCEGVEVFVVCVYENDDALINANWKSSAGTVQLWLLDYSKNAERASIRPWFVFRCLEGVALSATWLDRPKSEDDVSLIGFFAVGTSLGSVLIYRVDSSCTKLTASSQPPLLDLAPSIVLRQPSQAEPSTDDETSGTLSSIPVLRVAWCPGGAGQYIAAVCASGSVVFWNLCESFSEPKFLRDSKWASPANDVCFLNDFQLAVAFREKCFRVYDVRSWECLLQENTIRTAGARVVSNPRILPGLLTFQSEYFASSSVPATGVAYIASEPTNQGYFVVPLANRHDLQMWDVCVSSLNGVVASCGVDGKMLLSANGHVAPHSAKIDCGFSIMRESLTITRMRIAEEQDLDENGQPKLNPALTKYEDICEKSWLEVALEPVKQKNASVEYASLDRRMESLNCVDSNRFGRKPFVITGGQAGLLFCRPCAIGDDPLWEDPGNLSNKVASGQSSRRKSK